MWDSPGPGMEAVSPALAGRFPTTGPPGKSSIFSFVHFSIVGHWFAKMAGWMAARPRDASSAESYTVSPVSIATSEIAQWCSFNHGWISGSPGNLPWDTDAGSHHLPINSGWCLLLPPGLMACAEVSTGVANSCSAPRELSF